MPVTITSCPECKTMVFNDTVQCPSCLHVLNKSDAESPQRESSSLPTGIVEDRCSSCGEMVRRGLVRCWNCSEFIRKDIAESYNRMQSTPQPVIYSELPEIPPGSDKTELLPEPVETFQAADRDFELSASLTEPAKKPDATPTLVQSTPPIEVAAEESIPVVETPKAEQAPEEAASSENSDATKAQPEEPDVDHSIATGGEALLEIAMQEEREQKRQRKSRRVRRKNAPRASGGLLIFCPNGHRIEVQEKYRGLTGRCPKCKSPFIVPSEATSSQKEDDASKEAEEQVSPEVAGKYTRWLNDVNTHMVNPERLKLKPNSLKNDFRLFDLGFADDELIALTFTKRKGAAGATSKKRLGDREKLLAELREGKTAADLTATEVVTFAADRVKEIRVVQPAAYAHESMFAGIPVFGEHRVAVRLTNEGADEKPLFFSFFLSEFRKLSELLAEKYDVKDLGEDCGVPQTDSFKELKCHYSDDPLKVLENADWYQADPAMKVELVGRECEGCGLIVSENSRAKEKIGGANGRAIAKARCPKCKKKFGTTSLFTLIVEEAAPAETDADANSESAKK